MLTKKLGVAIALVAMLAITAAITAVCRLGIGVQASDAPGVYEVHLIGGTDRITLNEDGTYLQEVTMNGSAERVTNSGRWAYDNGDVDIHDCLDVDDGHGRIRPDFATPISLCSYPLTRSAYLIGPLRLESSESHPYKKTD